MLTVPAHFLRESVPALRFIGENALPDAKPMLRYTRYLLFIFTGVLTILYWYRVILVF